MTKKEIKTEALRTATAMLFHPPTDWSETGVSEDDMIKIHAEIKKIAESLYRRAVKSGGDFNPYTGYE